MVARLQRNENFFAQRGGDANAAEKVRRAYQRCAESGTLNLSNQKLRLGVDYTEETETT